MKAINWIIISLLFVSCSSKKESTKEDPIEHQTQEQTVNNPSPTNTVTTYKENSTLVSAILDTLIFLDEYNYELKVKIITAIPDNWSESVIEPDQEVTIYPAYILDENQNIDLKNPINQKIYELRNLVKKGMFIGTVTLAQDNKYYVKKVDVWNNPPEMKK